MTARRRLTVTGIVQGVGFRPFVHRTATSLSLTGSVANTPSGVVMEIQGGVELLDRFGELLLSGSPPLARIDSVTVEEIPSVEGESGFSILESGGGDPLVSLPPDCEVCADCLRELFDPADRRHRHPFVTCTNCGPRFSIIERIPYDRQNTSMGEFPLCPRCKAEYADPANRRFHAEPLCCPDCGPRLSLLDRDGVAMPGDPVRGAQDLLAEGKIVAVKGVGGFHLAVDARNDEGVRTLRERKRRPEKPFAVMVADLESAAGIVEVDPLSRRLLESPERPVVILRKRPSEVAPSVSPRNGWLGVMLPSTPLQHLLLEGGRTILVMTSANFSDEPVVACNDEALERLGGVADAFLLHNRQIVNRCDDSVLRVFRGEPLFYRRSRGYVPRAIPLPASPPPLLALGAELKGTVTLTRGDRAFVSQHLGDVSGEEGLRFLSEAAEGMKRLLGIEPVRVAHDAHPDFLTTRLALESGLPQTAVQHHHAHFAAVLGENRHGGEAIGVIFDGTGLGEDGTIRGGELFTGSIRSVLRAGSLLPVPLPGGDGAVREPWRMALSWIRASVGDGWEEAARPLFPEVDPSAIPFLSRMMEKGLNSPPTTSAGRLFDAVSAILGIRRTISYEGQAAIELEGVAEGGTLPTPPLTMEVGRVADHLVIDPRPFVRGLLRLLERAAVEDLAYAFHHSLADAVTRGCLVLREETGIDTVALSGGVFQNRLLTELLGGMLEERGVRLLVHRLLPPNDACISYGQAVIASLSDG